jgi:hypothetical protein
MSYEEDKPSESLYKPLSGYSSNINPTAPLPEPVTNQEGLYIPPPPSYTTATTVGQGYQALPASYYPAPPHHTRFQTEIKQEDVRKYLKILYFLICISFICCFPFGFIVYFVSKQVSNLNLQDGWALAHVAPILLVYLTGTEILQ